MQKKTIQELFEDRAHELPNKVALVCENEKITYRELNQKANQLAQYLLKQYYLRYAKSMPAESLIGLCVERSIEMIIGILAILKTGAAYVPLDPSYPQERLQFILNDANIDIILTQKNIVADNHFLTEDCKTVIYLDHDADEIFKFPSQNLALTYSLNNLAYVIYTSGTTGEPKGVLISNFNVVRLFTATEELYRFNENDTWTVFHSYAFDFSVWEIWGALLYGGKLVIVPKFIAKDTNKFLQLLHEQAVTVLNQTPSAFKQLSIVDQNYAKRLLALRYLIFGGEVLTVNHIREWCTKYGYDHPQLINMYGITETTVHASFYRISSNDLTGKIPNISIGKPLSDLEFYLLDKNLKPKAINAAGELYIGGAGLARGYLNRYDLTNKRFVKNPFKNNDKLYKSGDLVRLLANGSFEYLGRTDDQVKIRGFRIELGDIEAALLQHPDINQCVVITRDHDEDKQLIAYYNLKHVKTASISTDQIRSWLGTKLPDYMIPAVFMKVTAFFLTLNGKIDKKKLPQPVITSNAQYLAARSEVELALTEIWTEVLKIPLISILDDFFALGGNSLLATQIISRVNNIFKIDCPIRMIFEHQTVEQLATYVHQQLSNPSLIKEPINTIKRNQLLALSFAQQRLWFLNQYEDEKYATYNTPFAFKLIGKLHVHVVEQSFNYLINRHEIFRTEFINVDGEPKQKIIPQLFIKLHAEPINKAQLSKILAAEALAPFDLTIAPLLRVRVLKINPTTHILTINMHHIITDGWSEDIIFREISTIYNAIINKQEPTLPLLPIQYVDFAYWQRKWLTSEILKNQLDYWQNELKDFSTLNLTTDFPRPTIKTYNGGHYQFLLERKLSDDLKRFARKNNATLFMTMLAAFNVLLGHYCGQDDLIVGTPIANRCHPEVENIVGFFVNTLAIRVSLVDDPNFNELVSQVKEKCLQAYTHQDIPFEYLVEHLRIPRDLSRSPIFQILFVLQTMTELTGLSLQNIKTEKVSIEYNSAKFDLLINTFETEAGLGVEIEYNTDLFKTATIHSLAHHYKILLHSAITNPENKISSLKYLSDTDLKVLLEDRIKTQKSYPQTKVVHELFIKQAMKKPDNIAVVCDDRQLSYKELNNKSNQLAHYLKANAKKINSSIKPDTLIALCMDRDIEMIIGILGILKTGAGYVPMSSNTPPARMAQILHNANIKIIITNQNIYQKFSTTFANLALIVCLDSEWSEIAHHVDTNLSLVSKPENIAYVIHTSGSTGIPKGVILEHKTITNLIHWQSLDKTRTKVRVTQFADVSFDVSVQEIFYALLNGLQLHIISELLKKSPADFVNYVKQHKINTVFMPTGLLEHFAAEALLFKQKNFIHLREIIVAGEALQITNNIMDFFAANPQIALFNHYGPTESHVVTSYKLPKNPHQWTKLPPIGKPINNTQLYILDKKLQPLPIGVPGELYIGGVGVARGYLKLIPQGLSCAQNNGGLPRGRGVAPHLGQAREFIPRVQSEQLNLPDQTHEKFINNPFIKEGEMPAKLYKTGDLVRWLADGNIAFLGRIDNQVKIRGFRIELSEIEAVLGRYPEITKVVATTYGTDIERQLAAYYLSNHGKSISNAKLRSFLHNQLPQYMIPSAFVHIKKLPMTSSGKVDYRQLPEPKLVNLRKTKYLPPQTSTEKQLAEIWMNILSLKKIGINDNFFEIGGNSLLLIKMLTHVREKFKLIPLGLPRAQSEESSQAISVIQMFSFPVISALAKYIELAQKSNTTTDTNLTLALEDAQIKIPVKNTLTQPIDFIDPKNVLLTGVTGFLGAYLLEQLISITSAKIFCLIRGETYKEIKQRFIDTLKYSELEHLINNSRIILLKGDLSKKRLGLAPKVFSQLIEELDQIYHNGALVHHLYDYKFLRAPNVLSTVELIKMAFNGKPKVFNFVSTAATANHYAQHEIIQAELGEKPSSVIGYVMSKWVSEKILIQAASQGLTVNIFRPGYITGHSRTGVYFARKNHQLLLLKGCIQMQCAPDWENIIEMTPVDIISEAIIRLSLHKHYNGKTYNLYNPILITWLDYIAQLKQEGFNLKILPASKWLKKLQKIDESNALFPLKELYLDKKQDVMPTKIMKLKENNVLETQNLLIKKGVYYPQDYTHLIKIYVRYLRRIGFFT